MTHTTSFKRIMCCLLALLVLCTCMIRPLEVKAAAITGTLTVGAAACLIAATAGIVFNPQTVEDFVAIGEDFQKRIRDWGNATGKTAEAETLIAGLILYVSGGGGEDPTPPKRPFKFSQAAVAAIAFALSAIVKAGGVEVPGEQAPEGLAYFGDMLLPVIPSGYDYSSAYIFDYKNYTHLYLSTAPIYYEYASSKQTRLNSSKTTIYDFYFNSSKGLWVFDRTSTYSGDVILCNQIETATHYWCSLDSDPLPYQYEIIEADYMSEVLTPDENGQIEQEEIEKNLPAAIDPSTLLYNTQKEDLNQAVQEVMGQLASGEMTYDQYMESIQAEPEDNPEDNPEDETLPGTSPDPTPDGSGDAEVKSGLRKLVDFFTGTTYVQSPLLALNFGTLFDLFPFNIPAGIYQAINFWKADAEAPKLVLPTLAYDGDKLTGDEFTVDLAEFPGMNTIAALIRAGNLILFGIGLLLITRKVTKW